MHKRINFIVVSGGSGVGKTTVFDELVRRKEAGELDFDVPLKLTTRPNRPSDNPMEIKSVSSEEYEQAVKENRFLIEWERHGHKYGVLRSDKESQETQVQIIPARDVIPLRESLKDTVNFVVVILNADPDVINERRKLRGDDVSESEAKSREKTVKNKPLDKADFVVDANRPKEDVAEEMATIVRNFSAKEKYLKFIRRDDLKDEIEVASEILRMAKKQGINAFLFGGIAANVYGSEREITDLDILAGSPNFDWLLEHYSHPDLVVTKKKIEINRIEISKEPARVGDRALGQEWHFCEGALDKVKTITINRHALPMISPEDLILMKAGLGRGEEDGKFDLFDIKNIVATLGFDSIDWEYVIAKARDCKSYDRVIRSLNALGIKL